MTTADDAFLQQLRGTFRIEAEEHLETIAAGLMQLEQPLPPEVQQRLVEEVFRAAHSLKGAARAVDFHEIESACQSLEDTFAAWKRRESGPTRQALDHLHSRLTRITALLATTVTDAGPAIRAPASVSILPPVPTVVGVGVTVEPLAAAEPSATAAPTVRVSVDTLHERLIEAEEMLAVKLQAGQRAEELRQLYLRLNAWRNEAELAEGLHAHVQLKAIETTVATLARTAQEDRDLVAKLVDDLLVTSKKLLLLPFSTIVAPMRKLVRDLCREEGKEAAIKIEGEHIEVDKQILDTIKDPLIHLLRNCIAHGIEPPAERLRRGKPARAQLTVAVMQVGGSKVQITVADDGAGIDGERLKAAAVKQAVIGAEAAAALDEQQAQALVFHSGVSTSPIITELAGRGLGLAIVQEKALRLGGSVSVESRPGVSTVFRVVVPTMRGAFRGIVVAAAGRLLVLPTLQVARVARVRREEIRTVEGRETISLGGRVVPLVHLAELLEIEQTRTAAPATAEIAFVFVGDGDQCVAFAVDEVLEEQELLVKPLSRPLLRVRNVASVTVLPDGRIAVILQVADLLKSARVMPVAVRNAPPAPAPAKPRSILVAEDSITSRMLIKGMLEAAGYQVSVAPDGLDAFNRLRAGQFDLLVSDVEMPRLNGFDLTARIRADRRFTELPVVLVTALERREDRERGVDVGANAYIVKSSFDQSTLLEAVRRLL